MNGQDVETVKEVFASDIDQILVILIDVFWALTFRVKDCFIMDEGYFLYKVPPGV
jgi:hypothetical protein